MQTPTLSNFRFLGHEQRIRRPSLKGMRAGLLWFVFKRKFQVGQFLGDGANAPTEFCGAYQPVGDDQRHGTGDDGDDRERSHRRTEHVEQRLADRKDLRRKEVLAVAELFASQGLQEV